MHESAGRNGQRASGQIKARLAKGRENYSPVNRDLVLEVVTSVLTSMSGDLSPTETSLLGEIASLGRTIAAAKQEIASLRVDDITDRDIPFATDELDAIVEHTAGATNAILESCETMEEVAGTLTGEAATKLQDAVTKIYEACSFQDITGQRITKVVTTLKSIEAKIAQMIATFGAEGATYDMPVAAAVSADAQLLNGPQLPSNAMDQSDIDKLLASFG
jgi:chemotaxis protein CheZ